MENKRWNFWMDTKTETNPALDAAVAKLEPFLAAPSPFSECHGYLRDAFTGAGKPVLTASEGCGEWDVDCAWPITPFYAPVYLKTPLPASLLELEPEWRDFASEAAYSWACSVLGNPMPTERMNGLMFEYQGISVWFPIQIVSTDIGKTAIFPFADTFRNSNGWEGGRVPVYVEQAVRFLSWCCQEYHRQHGLNLEVYQIVVARIIGNLPADVDLRTITPNPQLDQRIADRVIRAVKAAQAAGERVLKVNRLDEIPWQERKAAELEDANQVQDEELYSRIEQYMPLRSERKELERQDAALKAEADAIAISLAAQIPNHGTDGSVLSGGRKYVVSHKPKRNGSVTISAKLLRQLAPDLECAISASAPRRTVDINVV